MDVKSSFTLRTGSGNNALELTCFPVGKDYLVFLGGGEEHIGAVGVGQSYGSGKRKSNASVIAVHGHKEDDLTINMSRKLSRELAATVTVVAGIHYDNLETSDIEAILRNTDILANQLLSKVRAGRDG